MPPVGQLERLDVVQRDALLKQDTAQVGSRELGEDVGHIWGRKGGQQGRGWRAGAAGKPGGCGYWWDVLMATLQPQGWSPGSPLRHTTFKLRFSQIQGGDDFVSSW